MQDCNGLATKDNPLRVEVGEDLLYFPMRDVTRAYYWYLVAFYCPDGNKTVGTAKQLDVSVHWIDYGSGEVPYNLSGLLLLQIILAGVCGLISMTIIIYKKFNIFKLFPLEIVYIIIIIKQLFAVSSLFECLYYGLEIVNHFTLKNTGYLMLGIWPYAFHAVSAVLITIFFYLVCDGYGISKYVQLFVFIIIIGISK